jgi:uncharacterized Zn-binding protein involved in type VI secretion
MKRLLVAGFALALLIPACAFAQSAFSGTWKMDPGTMHATGGKPMTMSLKDGMYKDNAVPPVSVKADGEDHAVTGNPGFDTVAVKVIDDHTVQRTEKKDGKPVWSGTFTVAADGKTAAADSTRYRDGSEVMSSKMTFDRVGKATAGSNAATGSWRPGHLVSASDAAMTDTYQVDGDKIDYKSGRGQGYSATIGGKAVPFMDNGKADGTVSVQRVGKNTLRETYAKDGKVSITSTMSLAADGKTMKTVNHSPKMGTTTSWTSNKQ